MSRILVVDDKEMMRDSVATTLSRQGHAIVTAPGGKSALDRIGKGGVDAVVTDLQMPEMSGLDLLRQIREIDEELPVILMTAFGTVETAVEAMKAGAYDYITKPFSGDELVIAVGRALERGRLLRENLVLQAAATPSGSRPEHAMVGRGAAMDTLREHCDRVAASHGTVLVMGESGAGKEVAARRIHENSPRAAAPFLAVNCAALSTSLLESELFGHEKGAFTGADRLRKGRFELADGGTLLLDEISEVAPSIQAKLLRVLQEQCFERVGSSRSLSVDVRVIATTNRDLALEVDAGRFRQDLFYRLNVLPVRMPALRDHVEDIDDLSSHFLARVAEREGGPAKSLAPDTLALLSGYAWPGNVRELQNICERAAVLAPGELIEAELVRPWLIGAEAPVLRTDLPAAQTIELKSLASNIICDGETTLADVQRDIIVATLRKYGGHRQKSARALGIGVRTLGLKLKDWKERGLVEQEL